MENLNIMTSYLEGVTNGKGCNQIEELFLPGFKIIDFRKGILRCKLIISDRVLIDGQGNDGIWKAGGMMGVMDTIGCATANSFGCGFHVTVSLNSSFYSTAKIGEEVEIEGRVTRSYGKLLTVETEIRREKNREVIAKGNLWVVPVGNDLKFFVSAITKSNL